MIERAFFNGPIVLRCDSCAGGFCETGEKDLAAGLAVAREEGWVVRREAASGAFFHHCDDCAEDAAWHRARSRRTAGRR